MKHKHLWISVEIVLPKSPWNIWETTAELSKEMVTDLWVKTREIITIGTCLGISGSFLKPAFPLGDILGVEGLAQVWKLAVTFQWGVC